MYIHLETHYNMMYGICKLTIGITTTTNNHKSITYLGCSEWIEHVVVVFKMYILCIHISRIQGQNPKVGGGGGGMLMTIKL
jgi:hypothetical protein